MADWDANSAQLEQNLLHLRENISTDARRRTVLSVESARQWHAATLNDLTAPDPRYVGRFRGERGLEKVQVHVGGRFGVAARDVATALARFEHTLQPVIARLDALIPSGTDANADQLAAVIEVCAWAHAEWIRTHPFANGNGRTARLWVNSIAMRYNLPPFVMQPDRLRARILVWTEEAIRLERLPRKSGSVLEAALYRAATPPPLSAPANVRPAASSPRSSSAASWYVRAPVPRCVLPRHARGALDAGSVF